ncbi:MAG: hypothetical protein ACI9WU_005006 [Myxococcota bacterium]
MSRTPSVAIVSLVVVVGLSTWSLAAAVNAGPDTPTLDQWDGARAYLAERWQDGDGVRVHPFWLREASGALATLDQATLPPEHLDLGWPADAVWAAQRGRVWVVSAMDRDDAVLPQGDVDLDETLPGGIRVRRVVMADNPVLFDLSNRLGEARVTREGPGGGLRRCVWRNGRHDCRGKHWENVRTDWVEVGGAPRSCIILHPYPDNGTVRLRFDNLPAGAGVLLRSGFTLESARNENGSDAVLSVRLGDDEVLRRVEPQNAWAWRDAWIPLDGSRRSLTVEVFAEKEAFRDLCVSGWVLSRRIDTP